MRRTVIVTQTVEVDFIESAFTADFINEFADRMYPFASVEEHVEHIAQLAARGLLEPLWRYEPGWAFIEGYGDAAEFLNRVEIVETQIDLSDQEASNE